MKKGTGVAGAFFKRYCMMPALLFYMHSAVLVSWVTLLQQAKDLLTNARNVGEISAPFFAFSQVSGWLTIGMTVSATLAFAHQDLPFQALP